MRISGPRIDSATQRTEDDEQLVLREGCRATVGLQPWRILAEALNHAVLPPKRAAPHLVGLQDILHVGIGDRV